MLQFTDPTRENYCKATTTGNCRLDLRWDTKGHTRPWGICIYIKIMGGYLDKGEKITLVFGDTAGGSPGWQIQTFVEKTLEFKTLIDPIATYEFKELDNSPEIEIVPDKPVKAVSIAPSQVKIATPFNYYLKLEDRWGNPVAKPKQLQHKGFAESGTQVLTVRDEETGIEASSNPINVYSTKPQNCHYWADFHGQSEETIGSNTINEYYTFAREYALLDIAAHQGNDFQITDEFWTKINKTAAGFNCTGSFVTFPGYEWSGNTPLGGDRNVYYKSEGEEVYRSCADLLPGKSTVFDLAPTANVLFEKLSGKEAFVFSHVGGRYADVTMHDENSEVAMEIHSAWGTFEWLVEDAFKLGYRIGICANSDGHKGRPGASYPGAKKFGSYGGLTCVLAPQLDSDQVFEAMKQRHFYATTGNRSVIELQCSTESGTAIMGDILQVGDTPPILKVKVTGTAPIEKIEIRNGLATVKTIRPYDETQLGNRIKIIWSGAEVRGRARITEWDGQLSIIDNRISSFIPVNFWNPLRPVIQKEPNILEWRSITSGGLAGVILKLPSGFTLGYQGTYPSLGDLYLY